MQADLAYISWLILLQEYPYKQDDIEYELEIKEAINKLPVEKRIQMIAMNHYVLRRKTRDSKDDHLIDAIVARYNDLEAPLLNTVRNSLSN